MAGDFDRTRSSLKSPQTYTTALVVHREAQQPGCKRYVSRYVVAAILTHLSAIQTGVLPTILINNMFTTPVIGVGDSEFMNAVSGSAVFRALLLIPTLTGT